MKGKKASTYISGFCTSTAKGGHARCGVHALPEEVTCRCGCHLRKAEGEAVDSFPPGEVVVRQTEATAVRISD